MAARTPEILLIGRRAPDSEEFQARQVDGASGLAPAPADDRNSRVETDGGRPGAVELSGDPRPAEVRPVEAGRLVLHHGVVVERLHPEGVADDDSVAGPEEDRPVPAEAPAPEAVEAGCPERTERDLGEPVDVLGPHERGGGLEPPETREIEALRQDDRVPPVVLLRR